MSFVITCADEGVQVNEGTRLGFVGAGFKLNHFSTVVTALKQLFGSDIRIAASEECDWIKEQLELSNWEQVTASSQQFVEALADKEGLLYAGFIPFSDPKQLKHEVKAHMVRPKGVHIANKVCFTLGGGEQTYNLGRFLLSAEWIHLVDPEVAKAVLQQQVEYLQKLVGPTKLMVVFETEGSLDPEIIAKNKALLESFGYIAS